MTKFLLTTFANTFAKFVCMFYKKVKKNLYEIVQKTKFKELL